MSYFGKAFTVPTAASNDEQPRNSMSLRKSLKKKASLQYPGRLMVWVGGVLYFQDTKNRVPGVQEVAKYGSTVKGWEANKPRDGRSRAEKRRGYSTHSSAAVSGGSSFSSRRNDSLSWL
jgi:hypothetical protein